MANKFNFIVVLMDVQKHCVPHLQRQRVQIIHKGIWDKIIAIQPQQ